MSTQRCTVTIFGRPLADMTQANADYFRGIVVHDCWCPDCRDWRKRQAAWAFDVSARILAQTERELAAW